MKKYLLTLLLLFSVGVLSAENKENRLGVWDSGNRHSLSFGVGFMSFLPNYYTSQDIGFIVFDSVDKENHNPAYYDYEQGRQFSMPVISLNYFYRVGRLFSIGCSVGYGHESTEINLKNSSEYALTMRDNVLLVTPTVRLHWLNSSRVEMYSGLGLIGYGLSVTSNAYRLEGKSCSNEGWAMQFTPIGVGVKLDHTYIFSELGLGVYGIVRVGVGHRF